MDQARFDEAKRTYDEGDFRGAAKGFLAAAGRETEGAGAAYHMAGNSLMKLRRHSDAVTVYQHAIRDDLYEKRGSVRANLAAALAAQGDYALAVEEYKAALEEPDYTKHYKALQGQAKCLCKMDRYEDAALAYRQAALDGGNPDPGTALSNLGMCFLAIDRPGDAVEAYKAALGFDDFEGKGRATANLGIALTAMGDHEEAVKAFDKATQFHGQSLTPQAVDAFNLSREAIEPKRETVEGWSTGEIPPVSPIASDEDPGWSTGDLRSLSGAHELTSTPPPPNTVSAEEAAAEVPGSSDDDESLFFNITDDEMKARDREARKAERKERRAGRNPWSLVFIGLAVILLVVAVFAGLYFMGIGYPTQEMTVGGMLDARAEGRPVENYWVAVPPTDVDKEMAKLPPVKEYEIASVERSPGSSSVTVVVTPENGAPLRYEIAMAREGVGWKVKGIENDWRSTGGGS